MQTLEEQAHAFWVVRKESEMYDIPCDPFFCRMEELVQQRIEENLPDTLTEYQMRYVRYQYFRIQEKKKTDKQLQEVLKFLSPRG